jgi:uncharacterized membrane protein YkoI
MLKWAIVIATIGFIGAAPTWSVQAQQAAATSLEQATRIARDSGMVTIGEIELDDGRWKIEGRNQAGERWEIHVDAASGRVLRNQRD